MGGGGQGAALWELEVAWVAWGELEAKWNVLWAQLEQGIGCSELAPPSLQDVVIVWMAFLSECPCFSDVPVLTFPV